MLIATGLDLRAVSVGGLETCIEVPSWKLCFDIGRCPPSAVRWPTVLFTHAHADHMGGIVHHCATRSLTSMSSPTYVLPEENHPDFLDLLAVWRRLDRSDLDCTVIGARPGQEIPLGKSRKIATFRPVHVVPSLGYALISERRKLKPEYQGMEGRELQGLRRSGVEIDSPEEVVEVAFCGDTTAHVLDREPLVHRARVLILEATFLDDKVSPEKARALGHVHLDDLLERLHLLQNPAIVLTHFSARYGRNEIVELLDRRLPPELRSRVTPLLPGYPWSDVIDE